MHMRTCFEPPARRAVLGEFDAAPARPTAGFMPPRPPRGDLPRRVADPMAPDAASIYEAYSRHGGMAHSEDLASWLRVRSDQPISQVAHWVVAREVVNFRWCGATHFPLFQFDLADMTLRSTARRLIAELAPALDDDLLLAEWFVRPNAFLAAARPLDLLDSAFADVLAAARADRFVVLG